MSQRRTPFRHLSLLLALLAGGGVALGAWRTFNTRGDAAVATFSPAEQDWFKRLGRLDRGMSRADVESVLGPADHWTGLGADEQGTWTDLPGAPLARLTVHIDRGRAERVRWIKIGYFTYDLTLKTPPPPG